MEIKQLEYFTMAARLGSISKAANALYITQPALSRSIKRLEEDIGFDLFERRNSRIVLTEAGEIFLEGVSKSMAFLDEGLANARRMAGVEKDKISLMSSVQELNQELLMRFYERYPDVTINLEFIRTREAMAKLVSGSVDFAVLHEVDFPPDVERVLLLSEEMFLYPAVNHRLYGKTSVELMDISGCDVVCNEIGFGRELIEAICRENGIELNLRFSSNDHRQVGAFKKFLGGLLFIPASALFAAEEDAYDENLGDAPRNLLPPVRIYPGVFRRNVYLAYMKGKKLTPGEKYLISSIKAYYDALGVKIKRYVQKTYE